MLRLDEHYIWDSWIADDGELYHLFFLQAPRSLGSPGHRHVNAVVGHATSVDLVDWDYLGVCFGPAESGWDDMAIWTGSVVREGGRWRMFYTAINKEGHGVYDQRVGSAISDDLHHWTRVGDQSVAHPDPRWYKTLALVPPPEPHAAPLDGRSETWRDPLAMPDPEGNGWHLLITARSAFAGRNDDGVIAHAAGPDLDHLEIGPPLCAPGAGFGQLEVPQNKIIDGRPVLVFTCHPQEMTAERIAASGEYCTWSVPSRGAWSLGHQSGARLHRRTGSVRCAAGATTGWQLGDHRLSQPGAEGHRRVRDHRSHPREVGRRGLPRPAQSLSAAIAP